MNLQNVIFQTNQNSRIIAGKQVLKNGSQVLVRVIADKGSGKYEGSVAGVRVNLTSSKKLEIGSTFLASISEKNGQIQVTPKENQTILQNNVETQLLQNSQLSSFLSSLGLPPDNLSLHLMQQLKQLELKMNPALLQKLHNLSAKFKGKEKIASEVLLVLEEKGLHTTEDELMEMLLALEGKYEEENSSESEKENKRFKLLNKVNETEGKWYFLPFEIITVAENDVLGNGNVKLMIDSLQKLKLMNVDCNFNGGKYLFSAEFNNGKCKNIKFNVDSGHPEEMVRKLKEKVSLFMDDTEVLWEDSRMVEGTSCANEQFFAINGVV